MCKDHPETPFNRFGLKLTLQDWIKVFDERAEVIRQKIAKFTLRPGDPELRYIYGTFRQVVQTERNDVIAELKDCPPLPDVPAPIGNDYFKRMEKLETFCRKSAAILRGKQAEPLSKNAEIVYDILDKLPPHKALTVPEILDRVSETHGKQWDEKELYERVFPQLRQWGLNNKPRIGYWIVK